MNTCSERNFLLLIYVVSSLMAYDSTGGNIQATLEFPLFVLVCAGAVVGTLLVISSFLFFAMLGLWTLLIRLRYQREIMVA